MKNLKKEFMITIPTSFGIGIRKIKAKSFKDCFMTLSKKDKMKQGFIEDEEGNSFTFNQILGLEETI